MTEKYRIYMITPAEPDQGDGFVVTHRNIWLFDKSADEIDQEIATQLTEFGEEYKGDMPEYDGSARILTESEILNFWPEEYPDGKVLWVWDEEYGLVYT